MICRAREKSNNNNSLQMLRRFRSLIDDLELKEFPLLGRRFTWSNVRERERHCSLILKKMQVQQFRGFRFESHCLQMQGFREVVESAWGAEAISNNAMWVLHIKLAHTGKALRKWNRGIKKKRTLVVDLANDIIFRLDVAQEDHDLSAEERELRRLHKARLLNFAAIERAMWKQRSHLTTIRAGDGNTKLFHLRANGHRTKNHIPVLDVGLGPISDYHGEKADILRQHFNNLLGSRGVRTHRLNWDFLNLPRVDMSHLDVAFEEELMEQSLSGMRKRHQGLMVLLGDFSSPAGM